jgi:hypothetical protein
MREATILPALVLTTAITQYEMKLSFSETSNSGDHLETGELVIFSKLKWSGNYLVQNFVGRNKLTLPGECEVH